MSDVFFAPFKKNTPYQALEKLLLKFPNIFSQGEYIAIKVHFGEPGNKTFIPSVLLKPVIDKLKQIKAVPFVTDTNVLYRSRRSETVTHLQVAFEHGFSIETLNTPVLIADGMKGGDVVYVDMCGKYFKKFPVAGSLVRSDGLVVFSHFKGHLIAGAGGAIKNISMGGASRAGKQIMHADVIPERDTSVECMFCGKCVKICPVNAIILNSDGPVFDNQTCIGCGECIAVCSYGVIKILWNETPEIFSEKLAEGAKASLKGKEDKVVFINGLLNITPECDCMTDGGEPMLSDIGWLLSTDPVSIDQASFDIVLEYYKLENSSDSDPFKLAHSNTYFERTLSYGEEISMGSRAYNIIIVE